MDRWFVSVLVLVLATSKVISGPIPLVIVHINGNFIALTHWAEVGNQATSSITQYLTHPHYPDRANQSLPHPNNAECQVNQ